MHRHDGTLEGVVCHGDPINKVDYLGLASVVLLPDPSGYEVLTDNVGDVLAVFTPEQVKVRES